MKKNKWLRLASVLLVLCLLTTSVISGTFAKYVTSDSGSDSARVAKWGVVATVSGNLFGPSYAPASQNNIQKWDNENHATVASNTTAENLVAPGTVGGTMTYGAKGTPEVSAEVSFGGELGADGTATGFENTTVVLKAGSYGVMVPYTGVKTEDNIRNFYYKSGAESFAKETAAAPVAGRDYYELREVTGTIAADYFPLVWSYTVGSGSATKTRDLSEAFNAITEAFTDVTDPLNPSPVAFNPNESIDISATLSWEWFFEGDLTGTTAGAANTGSIYSNQDRADTILGDLIAATTAGIINGDQYIVKMTSDTQGSIVHIATVSVSGTSTNTVPVAYTGTAAPSDASAADVAILGVAVGASITVTQVD